MNVIAEVLNMLYSHEGPIMVFDGTISMSTKKESIEIRLCDIMSWKEFIWKESL